jgi:hypothetical protein
VQDASEFLRLLAAQTVDGGEIGGEDQLVPVVGGADQRSHRVMIRRQRADATLQRDIRLHGECEHRQQPLARLPAAPRLARGPLHLVGPVARHRQRKVAPVGEMGAKVGLLAAEPRAQGCDVERRRPLAPEQRHAERHPVFGGHLRFSHDRLA